MSSSALYKESHESLPKTYYYIDSRACQRERCIRSMIIVNDFDGFCGDIKDVKFFMTKDPGNIFKLTTEVILEMQPHTNKEFVTFSREFIIEQWFKSEPKPYILVGSMPTFFWEGNYYRESGYIIIDHTYVTMESLGFSSNAMYIVFEGVQYLCSVLARECGYCQDKGGESPMFSNIIARDVVSNNHYPSVPIMGHNCKQCGVCLIACKHRNAIRNQIVNRPVEINEIDDNKGDISSYTARNQRALNGENLET